MRKKIILTMMVLGLLTMFLTPELYGAPKPNKDYKVIKNGVKKGRSGGEVSWFKILVTDEKGKPKVKVTLPVLVIDWIADCTDGDINITGDNCRVNFKKMLKALKKHGPLTIIEAYDDDSKETVKIWFE